LAILLLVSLSLIQLPGTFNVANALASSGNKIVPEVLVSGGGGSGAIEGLSAMLTKYFLTQPATTDAPEEVRAES